MGKNLPPQNVSLTLIPYSYSSYPSHSSETSNACFVFILQNWFLPSPSTSCLVSEVEYINYDLIDSLNSYDLPDYQHNMNPTIHRIQSYSTSTCYRKISLDPTFDQGRVPIIPGKAEDKQTMDPAFYYPTGAKTVFSDPENVQICFIF